MPILSKYLANKIRGYTSARPQGKDYFGLAAFSEQGRRNYIGNLLVPGKKSKGGKILMLNKYHNYKGSWNLV
ncbi:hypothetical protein AB0758_00595 [Tolypothrix bouteillei VB521301_2]|uniref:hypothetical protein n=1 Tax=Tolypothrix bouteillei TaxID=1246981 RepID=UPI0038B65B6C